MTTDTSAAVRASAAARAKTACTLRHIDSGRLLLTDVLIAANPTDAEALATLRRVRAERLLRAIPGVGDATATTICRMAQVDRGTRIGNLSARRRQQLANAVASFDLHTYSGTGQRRRAS